MRGIELPAGTEDKRTAAAFMLQTALSLQQITRQGTGICLRHFWERR